MKHKHYFLCYDLDSGSGTERCHHTVDFAPFVDKQLTHVLKLCFVLSSSEWWHSYR